jgi:hypothetical protein
MPSDKELIEKYLTSYNELLSAIEVFGLKYPGNNDGYNFLVDLAAKKREVALNIGLSDMEELPAKK